MSSRAVRGPEKKVKPNNPSCSHSDSTIHRNAPTKRQRRQSSTSNCRQIPGYSSYLVPTHCDGVCFDVRHATSNSDQASNRTDNDAPPSIITHHDILKHALRPQCRLVTVNNPRATRLHALARLNLWLHHRRPQPHSQPAIPRQPRRSIPKPPIRFVLFRQTSNRSSPRDPPPCRSHNVQLPASHSCQRLRHPRSPTYY